MNIKITSFKEDEAVIRSVRDAVFGREQKIAPELNWDGKDPDCFQVVAFDQKKNPIGTGRMQPDGKIGRLAVLKQFRGQGIGKKMLEALIKEAKINGLTQVRLHSQAHATLFYEKTGFKKVGKEFMEAGIAHIKMKYNLTT